MKAVGNKKLQRALLRERAIKARDAITDEEDRALTEAAVADPDNPPLEGPPRPRGRPRLDSPKKQVTLRLDDDVLEHFKSEGKGWQTRINETLRKAAKLT